MTIPYIPGWGDTVARNAQQYLVPAIKGLINPYHEMERIFQESIASNPESVNPLIDLVKTNPELATKTYGERVVGQLQGMDYTPTYKRKLEIEDLDRRAKTAGVTTAEAQANIAADLAAAERTRATSYVQAMDRVRSMVAGNPELEAEINASIAGVVGPAELAGIRTQNRIRELQIQGLETEQADLEKLKTYLNSGQLDVNKLVRGQGDPEMMRILFGTEGGRAYYGQILDTYQQERRDAAAFARVSAREDAIANRQGRVNISQLQNALTSKRRLALQIERELADKGSKLRKENRDERIASLNALQNEIFDIQLQLNPDAAQLRIFSWEDRRWGRGRLTSMNSTGQLEVPLSEDELKPFRDRLNSVPPAQRGDALAQLRELNSDIADRLEAESELGIDLTPEPKTSTSATRPAKPEQPRTSYNDSTSAQLRELRAQEVKQRFKLTDGEYNKLVEFYGPNKINANTVAAVRAMLNAARQPR